MYHSWSFRIPVRSGLDPATVRVLEAVARDTPPAVADLDTLHPVVAHYLADWRRLLTGEQPPYVGSAGGDLVVPIEFSQHDDEFASGGYSLWVWTLQLIARPQRDRIRVGHHALDLDDLDWHAIIADAAGIDEGRGDIVSWDDIDQSWAELGNDPSSSTLGRG